MIVRNVHMHYISHCMLGGLFGVELHFITITFLKLRSSHYIAHCMLGSFVERRILLPAPEPLSPVRSQGPKVVQTGPKLPLKRNAKGVKIAFKSNAKGAKITFVVKTGPKCL